MVLLDHLTTLQMNEKFWQESKFVHPETEFLVHLSGMLSFESGVVLPGQWKTTLGSPDQI